jgi:hypothetical protein
MQIGPKLHRDDDLRCSETLRTIFAPDNFGNVDMEILEKVTMCDEDILIEPPTGDVLPTK